MNPSYLYENWDSIADRQEGVLEGIVTDMRGEYDQGRLRIVLNIEVVNVRESKIPFLAGRHVKIKEVE